LRARSILPRNGSNVETRGCTHVSRHSTRFSVKHPCRNPFLDAEHVSRQRAIRLAYVTQINLTYVKVAVYPSALLPDGRKQSPRKLLGSSDSYEGVALSTSVLTEVSGDVTTVTINRPESLNALNESTFQAIGKAVTEAAANSRALILTGNERSF